MYSVSEPSLPLPFTHTLSSAPGARATGCSGPKLALASGAYVTSAHGSPFGPLPGLGVMVSLFGPADVHWSGGSNTAIGAASAAEAITESRMTAVVGR